jgi:uncharacterized RDD family membrane protein YckC
VTEPENPPEPNPYGTPQYGVPQYPPPAAGTPQYGTPQYGAPPPYAATPYGSPQYGEAGHGNAGQLATWIYRVGGRVIDGLVVGVPAAIIGLVLGSRVIENILSIVGLVVIGYLNGATGQTPGKRVVGLRLIREQDGQVLGAGMGIVREIAHFVDSIACLIGWLWPLWDRKRQTFADKICSSVVVRT